MSDKKLEGWFDQNPDKKQHAEMRDAMIEHFARNHMADERPEDLGPICCDIVDLLEAKQPQWKSASRHQMTVKLKRYRSLNDMVRRAYADRAKTEQAIGNYIIEDILAEGGMARVYRAKHYLLNSKHAIKVLLEP